MLNDLPFSGLIKTLRDCAVHRIPRKSDQKEFLSILRKSEQTAKKRNELLHALWLINEGKPVFCYRRRNKAHSPAPTIDEINELTDSIFPLVDAFLKFKKRQPLATPAREVLENALMEQKKKIALRKAAVSRMKPLSLPQCNFCYHAATGTCQSIPTHQEDGSSESTVFPWDSSSWVMSDWSESSL